MKGVLRAAGPALLAAAAVAALEWPLRVGLSWAALRNPPPVFLPAIFSRDVWANDNLLRRCAGHSEGVVLLTGGSPMKSLDRRMLWWQLNPLGVEPCRLPFAGGLYPAELNAYFPELRAARPRALVLQVGPPNFEAYPFRMLYRLTSFRAERILPFLTGQEAWSLRRLFIRSWLARALAAFRYRFLMRALVWPSRYPSNNTRFQEVPAEAPSRAVISRGRQAWMFEHFFARWAETGIPLIVWVAPIDASGRLPGARNTPQELAAFHELVRCACRRHGAIFFAPDRLPAFRTEEFKDATHLTSTGGARLTRALLPIIQASLSSEAPKAK